MLYKTDYISPLGILTLAGDEKNLYQLNLKEKIKNENIIQKDDLEIFNNTKIWLDSYFDNKIKNISVPLNPQGSEFQKSVWQLLLKIPHGTTTTYKEIAQKIAKQKGIEKMSAQAIGGAISKNPILIIIPCHRVIATNGNLTGFALGLDMKKKLLEIENIAVSSHKI